MCFHEAPQSAEFKARVERMAKFGLIPLTLHNPNGERNYLGRFAEFASIFVYRNGNTIARGYTDLARWHPGYSMTDQEGDRLRDLRLDVAYMIRGFLGAIGRSEQSHPSVEFDSMPEPEAMVTLARYGYLDSYWGAQDNDAAIHVIDGIGYDRMDEVRAFLDAEKQEKRAIANAGKVVHIQV